MKLPTDFQILNYIYSHYYEPFSAFDKDSPERRTKIYIPIDISAISKRFGVDPDIVFGRLYYHLEEKLSYKRSDGSNVHFFILTDGSDRHCVNFPLLASILAGMRQERRRDLWAIWIALTSIVISVFSIVVSLIRP